MTMLETLPYAGAEGSGFVRRAELTALRMICGQQQRALADMQLRVAVLESLLFPDREVAPRQVMAGCRTMVAQMIAVAAQVCGVVPADIIGTSRARRLAMVRSLIASEARDRGLTLVQIGEILGGRDHTTIMLSVKSRLRALDYFGLPPDFRLIDGEAAA